jgi:predicted metalloprotease
MEYVARQDGRITDSVYLQIHPEILRVEGVMFTVDVSNKSGVEIISLEEALEAIDFQVLYTRTDWNDPEIQRRLRQAEKYELLVPNHVPIKYIRNLP